MLASAAVLLVVCMGNTHVLSRASQRSFRRAVAAGRAGQRARWTSRVFSPLVHTRWMSLACSPIS